MSSGHDDDDTPHDRPRARHMTSDDRALARRRVTTAVRGTLISGVPVVTRESVDVDVTDLEDQTPVFDLVLVDPEAPVTAEQLHAQIRELTQWIKAIRRQLEQKTETRSDEERRGIAEIRGLLAQPPHAKVAELVAAVKELDGRLDAQGVAIGELRHDLAPISKFAKWALGSVVAVGLAVGAFLYTRGGDDREVKLKIEQLERSVERLERLERHSARPIPPASAPVDAVSSATTKDSNP